ncbi:MAG: GerMN domain-containing protein [Bacilli bacterium]|nr:GerMN domain-containing protein [Bacilli bacterium]
MIKNMLLRRFCIASLLFLVAFVLYSYPKELNQNIDTFFNKQNIYLIDLNNLVALTQVNIEDDSSVNSMIENTINCLTIDSSCDTKNFNKIIPKDTKLLDYSVNENILKIDFSKEFFNVSKDNEEKMLESIIFSLTEIKGIDKIMIFIEGNLLSKLPHSSKKLDLYLDRSFGINKVYNITNIKDTSLVTVYYLDHNCSYFVPVSYITNDDNKLEIIINNLKTNSYPIGNLSSMLDYQVELIDYVLEDEELTLNFNNILLNSVVNGSLTEEVKYAIYYSIKDSFGIDNVVFNINDKKIDYLGLAK